MLPRAAWLLFAGTFISKFGSFVLVFLAVYLTREGYGAAQAGVALSAYGIGAVVSQPAGGYLADRLGRRNTIALSMFASAVAMLSLSQAQGLAAIVTFAGLAGLAAELYRPAAGALLADLTPAGQRVPAFAMNRLAVNAGFAAGPAVGGFLAERSFFLLFLGDAITSAAFGIVALLALPQGERSRGGEGEKGWLRAMVRDRGYLLFLLATVAGALVLVQAFTTFAVQVSARFSSAAYGSLISLNGLLIVFLELPIASITQRLPPRPVMAVGLLLLGLGFGLTGLAVTIPLLALAVVVWTLGEISFMPVAGAYVADVAPVQLRGRYQGAWGSSFGVAFVLGPAIGTVVYSAGPPLLWSGCVVMGALAALLVLGGTRRPEAG
ncbi:MAG: MFS transporter [Gemmatimonadetes bacterium]|nr:MFS transporter [Gemmatimonadota bacterium]NIO31684.1 MFS transporter [Gemmatimonadota bacterium]